MVYDVYGIVDPTLGNRWKQIVCHFRTLGWRHPASRGGTLYTWDSWDHSCATFQVGTLTGCSIFLPRMKASFGRRRPAAYRISKVDTMGICIGGVNYSLVFTVLNDMLAWKNVDLLRYWGTDWPCDEAGAATCTDASLTYLLLPRVSTN